MLIHCGLDQDLTHSHNTVYAYFLLSRNVHTRPVVFLVPVNCIFLNRYALICQDEGLVPIVEPDISLNGNYDLETAVRVNVKVQVSLPNEFRQKPCSKSMRALSPRRLFFGTGRLCLRTACQYDPQDAHILLSRPTSLLLFPSLWQET